MFSEEEVSACRRSACRGRSWKSRRRLISGLLALSGIVAIVVSLSLTGVVTAKNIADGSGLVLLTVVVFFAWLLSSGQWTPVERKRLFVILGLFIAAAVFWSVFEQAGSTLNLFAERSTENRVLGYGFPAPWYQSVNSMFLISLAPVFAWLWIRLGSEGAIQPGEIRFRLITGGFRIFDPLDGSQGGRFGCEGEPNVADTHLSSPHDGRTLPESGRSQRYDETGSRERHWPDDGRLVSRVVGRQLHGWPDGVVI